MDGNGAAHEWMSVVELLEDRLAAGSVRAGHRIPSVRSLASHLHVKRRSVREAMRVLEVLGLISVRPSLTFGSTGIVLASPTGGLGALMRLQVAAQGFKTTDMARTRLLFECAAVKDLAERRDAVDLTLVHELLEAMDDLELKPREFLVLDGKFHLALAEASGNQVITAVMTGIRRSLEEGAFASEEDLSNWFSTAARLRAQHRGIVDAIDAGEGELAAQLMDEHISGFYNRTKLVSETP
ncbi:FadR/GntR family transcriptional regulator [Parafrigoribacterium soli]|uniref:FadR/GntR family transcriptional regulator n=1 Tax=Parafrigoribacterium soli TaxID=3144663 RepID=UPI0032ED8AD1